MAHGLMFHRFHKSGTRPFGQGSLSEAELEKILNYVGVERILSPQEWLLRVKSQSLQNDDICITFDDGLKSQFDIALPVLDRYGIKAFWFIFSSVFDGAIDRNEVYNCFATTAYTSFDEFVGEFFEFCPVHESELLRNGYSLYAKTLKGMFPFYSDSDIRFRFVRNKLLCRSDFEKIMDSIIQAKGLTVSVIADGLWLNNEHLYSLCQNGHCLGLHSYDHPFIMADLSVKEQEDQYRRNYQHLSHVAGDIVECMSHPLNSYTQDTINILSGMGIVCGFRSNMSLPDKPINDPRFELARKDAGHLLPAKFSHGVS